MPIEGSAYSAETSADTTFESPSPGTAGGYKHELASTKLRLQQALARERALLRAVSELIEHEETLSKLLACGADAADRVASLTPREREVMDQILAGHANKIIAAHIGLSQRTVEQHRASLMKKTGSKGLAALARLALAVAWNNPSQPAIGGAHNLRRARKSAA